MGEKREFGSSIEKGWDFEPRLFRLIRKRHNIDQQKRAVRKLARDIPTRVSGHWKDRRTPYEKDLAVKYAYQPD